MRITVRTLAGMLATLLLLIWIGYSQLPSFLYHNGYQEALLKWFPKSEYAKPAINSLAYELYNQTGFDGDSYMFIYPAGWSSSNSSSTVSMEQRKAVIDKLEELLDRYGRTPQTADVSFHLAKLYMWNKEWDQAERLYKEVKQYQESSDRWGLELEKFSAIVESRKMQPDKTPSVEGVVRIDGSPVADAFVYLVDTKSIGYHSPPYYDYPMTITDEQGRYRFYDQEPGDYYVGVGLQPEQVAGYHLAQSAEKTVSVKKEAVSPYNVDFAPQLKAISPASGDVIEGDEITFQWEPYAGADYYQLYITTILRDEGGKYEGSTTTTLTDQKHMGTSESFKLDELSAHVYDAGKYVDEKGDIEFDSQGLLGMLYPGGEFIWSVEAYDSEGRKLSSSAGYYLGEDALAPLFRISEKEMLAGDRLILEKRYKEAVMAYEREGDNDRALRVLAKLTEHGVTEAEGDPEKALAYLKRIRLPNAEDLADMERLKAKLQEP